MIQRGFTMKGNFRKHIFTSAAAFLAASSCFSLSAISAQAKTTIRLVRIEATYDDYDDKYGDKEDIPEATTGDPIDTDRLVVIATFKINEDGDIYEDERILSPNQYELSTNTVIKGLRTIEVTYTYKGTEKSDTFKLRGVGEVMYPDFEVDKKGRWYMIGQNGAMLKDGLYTIDGENYLFDEDGYLVSGWQFYKDRWYYFDEDDYEGIKGWKEIDSAVYFFDNESAMVTNYWDYHNDRWYYFGNSGVRSSGWIFTGGKWYYMNEDYTMHTGWLQDKGKWYYMDDSGQMVSGWKEIKGTWYYFNENGIMAANTFIGDYYVDGNGAWIPNWQSR
ncbi:MAG: hypothetical protein OSJ62_08715 [Lachnospiraceae bacterium]|nr:hypothetical protein [Lachnospiraceae bacterium]